MRRLPIALLVVVTACAGGGGSWPSLARRPIEGPPPVTTVPRKCAVAGAASCLPAPAPADAPAAPPPPIAPVAIDDIPARLAIIDRDLTDAAERLAAQRTTVAKATAAARGSATDSPASATVQLELTALDRLDNQVGDIRERLDAIAGTLAVASAAGSDVAAPLATTGRLIARATSLQSTDAAAAAALR